MHYKSITYPVNTNIVEIFFYDGYYYFKCEEESGLYIFVDERDYDNVKKTIVHIEQSSIISENDELKNALKILLGGE